MPDKVTVRIYFPKLGTSDPDNNPFNLQPVTRSVDKTKPIRPSINELLKGPSAKEQHQGFNRLDTEGLSIGFLARDGSQLKLNLITDGNKEWGSEDTFNAFVMALQRTVAQFPSIEAFDWTLDGEYLGTGC